MTFLTRREACRRTIAAAAALRGVHALPALAHTRSTLGKLRIGAIGVGNRGFDNLLAVAGEDIVALCDVDARYLDKARQQFRTAHAYRDYRELFAAEKLDGVVISTPDHTHALPAQLAFERHWHVYCEKPLAHNIAELRKMVAAAAGSSAVTQTGLQHHASPGYQQAISWLRRGTLGSVRAVHCWTNRPLWPQDQQRPAEQPPIPEYLAWDLWLGPAPVRPYHPAYHPLQWRGWWDFGTGALGDMGTHLLDPVVAGLDLPLPRRIEPVDSPAGEEGPPAASTLRFEFPAAGGAPPLVLHWYDGGRQPPAELAGAKRLPPNGCLVIGDERRMFIPELGRTPLLLNATGGRDANAPPPDAPAARRTLHDEWLAACRSTAKPSAPFAYGAKLTELCLLGNVALRVGRPFTWDAEQMRSPDCPETEPFLRREDRNF